MKYLILSDIHGSLPRLRQVMDFYESNGYDLLVILGDILNYGPRNGVPDGLDAPGIAALLNMHTDHIVAIRGNCDSEVDQMLLDFPCMGDYALLVVEGKRIFLTHGHRFNDGNLPKGIDAFFQGHTHLHKLERAGDVLVLNTGSITFPKNGNEPTFATIDGTVVRLRRLDGSVLKEMPFA